MRIVRRIEGRFAVANCNLLRSVYKIPPLKANEGHRAQDWGDLGNPLWKGRLRIIERSKGVSIQFEDATTGEI